MQSIEHQLPIKVTLHQSRAGQISAPRQQWLTREGRRSRRGLQSAVGEKAVLLLSHRQLRIQGTSETVSIDIESPFKITTSQHPLKRGMIELTVTVSQQMTSLSFGVVLPQDKVSRSVPHIESVPKLIDARDFARLWPALTAIAQIQGQHITGIDSELVHPGTQDMNLSIRAFKVRGDEHHLSIRHRHLSMIQFRALASLAFVGLQAFTLLSLVGLVELGSSWIFFLLFVLLVAPGLFTRVGDQDQDTVDRLYNQNSDLDLSHLLRTFFVTNISIIIQCHEGLKRLLLPTEISVDHEVLTIRKGPFEKATIPIWEVDQLYTSYTRDTFGERTHVHLLRTDGESVKLLGDIWDNSDAYKVERIIEDHLHIDDRNMDLLD